MNRTPLALLPILCVSIALAANAEGVAKSQIVKSEHLQERGTVLTQPVLPPQFRGHWTEDLTECQKDAVEDDQVWITGSALNYYETAGHLTRVVLENSRRAVATIRSEGEGRVFVSKTGLALSPDGKLLTLRDEDDTGSRRFFRCPLTSAEK